VCVLVDLGGRPTSQVGSAGVTSVGGDEPSDVDVGSRRAVGPCSGRAAHVSGG